MKSTFSIPVLFTVRTVFIAIFVNTIVCSSHILTDTDYTFTSILQTLGFASSVSALLFVPVAVIVFLLAQLRKKVKPDTLFWVITIIAIAATFVACDVFSDVFADYASKGSATGVFAGIATFSILVSLSAQYPLFIGEKEETVTAHA
ncbi:hypothetical protein [Limnovirga soli]|uniref:Uncharacterized protein n=1 Tax=Limnovirga soli TaxID=2656915 RepID=A0A8J8FCX9_9BACT|nr:hypothetical protein [Limnovirga soli]NNV55766.1 hypothetical protein [Limnovirga soli]